MQWVYKKKSNPEWESYFAWLPVPIGRYPLEDGQKIVWLEKVERKLIDFREGSAFYEYREI